MNRILVRRWGTPLHHVVWGSVLDIPPRLHDEPVVETSCQTTYGKTATFADAGWPLSFLDVVGAARYGCRPRPYGSQQRRYLNLGIRARFSVDICSTDYWSCCAASGQCVTVALSLAAVQTDRPGAQFKTLGKDWSSVDCPDAPLHGYTGNLITGAEVMSEIAELLSRLLPYLSDDDPYRAALVALSHAAGCPQPTRPALRSVR